MTESADTVGPHSVGAIGGYAVGTDTICTIGSDTVSTDAICAISSDTVCSDTISTIGSDTVGTNAISTISRYAVGPDAICTISSDMVDTNAVSTIGGDDRSSVLFGGNLRQGESTGGQSGNDEAGEDLLFHGHSPKEGVSNWLRGSCYARPKTAKGTSRDSDNQCHRYLEKRLSIRQIVITTNLSASLSPSVCSTALRVNGTGICIKNQ